MAWMESKADGQADEVIWLWKLSSPHVDQECTSSVRGRENMPRGMLGIFPRSDCGSDEGAGTVTLL